jgi:abortive infection bacteriophage resistance protein
MTQRPYTKPAKTFAEQVVLLRSRGMEIEDEKEAEFYLSHLNYYRLTAYWLPFEQDLITHQFKCGTTFTQVINLYVFDRELRLLLLDAIERVEVSIRTRWAYELGHRHGAHAYLEEKLAYKPSRWQSNLDSLRDEVRRSKEIFIDHFKKNYVEPLPPVWAVCEVMSLGLLSRWYANLGPMKTRRAIAASYGLDERVLESWLHHLSLIRNVCAHHSRLWNRKFSQMPQLPKRPIELGRQMRPGSMKVFNALVMLIYLMDQISPRHRWRSCVVDLIDKHQIDAAHMGAPEGWREMSLWQEKSQ